MIVPRGFCRSQHDDGRERPALRQERAERPRFPASSDLPWVLPPWTHSGAKTPGYAPSIRSRSALRYPKAFGPIHRRMASSSGTGDPSTGWLRCPRAAAGRRAPDRRRQRIVNDHAYALCMRRACPVHPNFFCRSGGCATGRQRPRRRPPAALLRAPEHARPSPPGRRWPRNAGPARLPSRGSRDRVGDGAVPDPVSASGTGSAGIGSPTVCQPLKASAARPGSDLVGGDPVAVSPPCTPSDTWRHRAQRVRRETVCVLRGVQRGRQPRQGDDQ
jgi:hypothetical protein